LFGDVSDMKNVSAGTNVQRDVAVCLRRLHVKSWILELCCSSFLFWDQRALIGQDGVFGGGRESMNISLSYFQQ